MTIAMEQRCSASQNLSLIICRVHRFITVFIEALLWALSVTKYILYILYTKRPRSLRGHVVAMGEKNKYLTNMAVSNTHTHTHQKAEFLLCQISFCSLFEQLTYFSALSSEGRGFLRYYILSFVIYAYSASCY